MTFAKLHDTVLNDVHLSSSAKMVYGVISRQCIKSEACRIRQSDIAARLRICRRQVVRSIKMLSERKYLFVQRNGDGQIATYFIGNLAKIRHAKMSHLKSNQMSHLKISDVTSMSHLKSKNSAISPDKISLYEKAAAAPRVILYNLQNDDERGGGIVKGGTNRPFASPQTWPSDIVVFFEKLIKKKPDRALLRYGPAFVSDQLEYLEYQLASGKVIDNRAAYLMEACRSNYAGQKTNGFRLARDIAAEKAAAEAKEQRRKLEAKLIHKKRIEDYERITMLVKKMLENLSPQGFAELKEYSRAILVRSGYVWPKDLINQGYCLDWFMRGIAQKIISGQKLTDIRVQNIEITADEFNGFRVLLGSLLCSAQKTPEVPV